MSDALEQYRTVCNQRFESINDELERRWEQDILPMRRDVGEIREKVFNGLSTLPKKMSWLTAAFVSVLIALLALMYQVGASQAKMIEKIESATERINE